MQHVFQGWKRKLGYGTLGLACLLAFVWIRSIFVFNVINIPIGGDEYFQFCSSGQNVNFGRLSLSRIGEGSQGALKLWMSGNNNQLDGERRAWCHLAIGNSWGSTGQSLSHDFGTANFDLTLKTPDGQYRAMCSSRAIPYWSIVLPLTLASAWLLISTLRSQHLLLYPRKKVEPQDVASNTSLTSLD